MLTWSSHKNDVFTEHEGTMNGVPYALIIVASTGQAFYQFRGLQGADLNSDYAKSASDLETAKKICNGMMSAWRHKAN